MTHSHFLDEEIISDVVARPARYIGLIGSNTKWERFSMRLEKRGLESESLKRVVCPIGTSKCGKAPKEVAISFANQLLSLHYDAP
jgi:xanthine dehydrogenase accessory factor